MALCLWKLRTWPKKIHQKRSLRVENLTLRRKFTKKDDIENWLLALLSINCIYISINRTTHYEKSDLFFLVLPPYCETKFSNSRPHQTPFDRKVKNSVLILLHKFWVSIFPHQAIHMIDKTYTLMSSDDIHINVSTTVAENMPFCWILKGYSHLMFEQIIL